MQTQAAASVQPKVPRRARAFAALAVSLIVSVGGASGAVAQDVRVVATADSAWTLPVIATVESALDSLAASGYLLARADTVRGDTLGVLLGPRARVASLEIVGAAALPDPTADWRTLQGGAFSSADLRRDLVRTAGRYARLGYPRAALAPQVEVGDGGRTVAVVVRVDEGSPGMVVAVELAGGRGPNRVFASRRAGLSAPARAADLDPERVRRALEATGLYREVGTPSLAVDGDDLVLQVPVVEAPPGTFDVVLGYLLPAGGANGGVVGRGRVDLRNLFGGGRTASALLERTPGLASIFALDVSDPFLFGTPFGVGVGFSGDSRDSTLSRQRIGIDVSYPLDLGFEIALSLAREAVRPGTFGAREVNGQPRVRRSDDLLAGVGIRLVRVDAPRNPRRGVTLSVLAEQGRRRTGLGDATRRRLGVRVRGYAPTFARQAVAIGLDATVTQSASRPGALADEGDLVRFGGAASFRGYDEASLLAESFGRGLVEYRVLFDQASFAFAFADAGGLNQPEVPGRAAQRRALFGYGAGLRVATALGLATITYALNPDLGLSRGKIHVGLTVGL